MARLEDDRAATTTAAVRAAGLHPTAADWPASVDRDGMELDVATTARSTLRGLAPAPRRVPAWEGASVANTALSDRRE